MNVCRAIALFAVLCAGAARAQAVVILELDGDTRGVVRAQLVEAVEQAGQVRVVAAGAYARAAAERGFPGAQANTPAAVRAVAPELGITAAVGGVVGERLLVRILDARGEQIWTRELPLIGGRLSADSARRLAAAIAVAAGPAPSSTPVESAEGQPSADASDAGPVGSPAPSARTVGPPLFSATAAGTATIHLYCSRPGVSSCAEWDAMEDGTEPPGTFVSLERPAPYLGYALAGEVFPLARSEGWWNGFGIEGEFAQAFSLLAVRLASGDATSPTQTVTASDIRWVGDLVYRYYFPFGAGGGGGYVGAHAGMRAHSYTIDPSANQLFSGTQRIHPGAGLNGFLPFSDRVRVEVAATFLVDPRPGADEVALYGTSVQSMGFSADVNVSGDLWGPLDYSARLRLEMYRDAFSGRGTWFPEGGVAQETYATFFAGVTGAL